MNTIQTMPSDLQKENASLKERIVALEVESAEHALTIKKLEEDKVRLYYKIGRLEFTEKDWEDFDPRECTIPFEQSIAETKKLLEGYAGDAK